MNCAAAHELMLTAEAMELEGRTDSDLARHVRMCTRCGAAAGRLLEAQRDLGRALDTVRPRLAPSEAVRIAGRVARRRRRLWRTVPLAAAAVLLGVLVARRPGVTPRPAPAPGPARPPHGVSVTAPPGRSVVVLQTDNPNVVVIWFF